MKSLRLAVLLALCALALTAGRAHADLFVSNLNGITRFDASGNPTSFASTGLSDPEGLAFDVAGNLYVADAGNNTIHRYSPTGADLGIFASTGLSSPIGLAFDAAGNL